MLEKLLFTPSRNRKKSALKEYIANTPDPDRGYALAAITGDFKMKNITASFYHELIKEHVDYELFKMSYDYVGDLAETISLIWPNTSENNLHELSLRKFIELISKLKHKQTILIVTHEPELFNNVKTDCYELNNGQLIPQTNNSTNQTINARFTN